MGRSPCCEKEHTNKGAWTKEEDEKLINHIKAYGEGCWRSLPKAAGLQRCGKSCRLRWINYLRPDVKRGNFTEDEDEIIINLHSLLGNKWSLIAARLPGRTDNEIKNYWNTHIKRKLLSRGIDPQTHRPLNSKTNTNTSTSTTSTTKTTLRSNNTNFNENFQLFNHVQGSTLQFGMASKLDFTTQSDASYVTSIIRASSINEHYSNNGIDDTSEEAYRELDLELSMSLPSPSSKFSIEMKNNEQQYTYQIMGIDNSTMPMSTKDVSVCLCYKLGFQNKGVCNCVPMANTTTRIVTSNE